MFLAFLIVLLICLLICSIYPICAQKYNKASSYAILFRIFPTFSSIFSCIIPYFVPYYPVAGTKRLTALLRRIEAERWSIA